MTPYEETANAPLSDTEWTARENAMEAAELRRDRDAEYRNLQLSDAECAERDAAWECSQARASAGLARAAKAWAAGELDGEGLYDAQQGAVAMGYYPAAVARPAPIGRQQAELFAPGEYKVA